jgi:hypothetical protein
LQHSPQTGRPPGVDRRSFLKAGAAAAIAISGTALINHTEAWGLETKTLPPETMRTLIVLARDIYPHDRLADRYYAIAIKGWDEKAASDAATKDMIIAGIVALDASAKAAHGVGYADVAWEVDRVALLRPISEGAFFQAVRSDLISSLYNQHEIWPLFGYEGESASKGGYIHRGFNDLDWL